MSSIGTSKGILEIGKFAFYVSIPIDLMYTLANNSENMKKLVQKVFFSSICYEIGVAFEVWLDTRPLIAPNTRILPRIPLCGSLECSSGLPMVFWDCTLVLKWSTKVILHCTLVLKWSTKVILHCTLSTTLRALSLGTTLRALRYYLSGLRSELLGIRSAGMLMLTIDLVYPYMGWLETRKLNSNPTTSDLLVKPVLGVLLICAVYNEMWNRAYMQPFPAKCRGLGTFLGGNGSFVGKRQRKAWKPVPLCLFGIEGQLEDQQRIGWKLVYVDHENDVLLVGDDPWEKQSDSEGVMRWDQFKSMPLAEPNGNGGFLYQS
ncbi:hypothetical protein AAG906_006726 [Vitis piasezkii]